MIEDDDDLLESHAEVVTEFVVDDDMRNWVIHVEAIQQESITTEQFIEHVEEVLDMLKSGEMAPFDSNGEEWNLN